MGKYRRMQNIFRADGMATIVAMDHGGTDGPLPGIIDPKETIVKIISGGADAILTTIGVAKKLEKELAPLGLIIRLDFPASGLVKGNGFDCKLIVEVEEAVKVGADAVIITAGPGEGVERTTVANITSVARECEKYGMVFIAEMYPGGFNPPSEMITIDTLKLAARMGVEYGADMLKMPYRPGYEEVIDGCLDVPVVVLGGAKVNNQKDFFINIYDAIKSGAKGVAIGRNVWGSPEPAKVVRTLNKLIHEEADVETAMKELN